MGRNRENSRNDTPEGRITSALLTGAGVKAVADQLTTVLPPGILNTPRIAIEVAGEVAQLIVSLPTDVPLPLAGTGIMREAALNALVYRARYAVAVVKRAAAAVLRRPEGTAVSDALYDFLQKERRLTASHRETTKRRVSSAAGAEALSNQYGPVLGWEHNHTGVSKEPRPTHVFAAKKNVDLRLGIPKSTGALPGVLPGCNCGFVAPFPGAPFIA